MRDLSRISFLETNDRNRVLQKTIRKFGQTNSYENLPICSLPPLGHTRLDLLPPPQTAPEDLRVVARKIEFPIVQADSSTTPVGDDLIEDELIEDFDDLGRESVHSQRSSDSGSGFPGQHECPDCGKTYSTSSNLARHRQTHRYDKICISI